MNVFAMPLSDKSTVQVVVVYIRREKPISKEYIGDNGIKQAEYVKQCWTSDGAFISESPASLLEINDYLVKSE